MLSVRRKPFPIGRSKAVTLPGTMEISEKVSMAASDRLIIMDTTGAIPEDKLLQFFIDYVEPAFERWQESQQHSKTTSQPGAFKPQEATGTPAQAKPGGVAVPPGFFPGPLVYEVTCPRCGRRFGWDVAGYGKHLFCFYCGMPIELVL